jgi:hypothetical protein
MQDEPIQIDEQAAVAIEPSEPIAPKHHHGGVVALIIVVALIAATGAYLYFHNKSTTQSSSHSSRAISAGSSFTYGFDFSDQGPDATTQDKEDKGNDPQAVASARNVLASFKGSLMDQSIYSFGAEDNPEPTQGSYNLDSINPRIATITTAGGIPVITLVQAPEWMNDGTGDPNSTSAFDSPPSPDHYQDFAALSAHIAQAYPQVKYFVVWSEMRGFYNNKTKSIDAVNYTAMYNDVYTAIKAVRPDAQIGGPYATMTSYSAPQPGNTSSTLHGPWGYLDPQAQTALSYWMNHNVGADFLAVDGATEIAKANDATLTDPLTASQKYAAVDQWLISQTHLPIWWMESHIAPNSGWTQQQGAAARIATLALMSSSGATVGMQWQPQAQTVSVDGQQTWPDEGLWTSTLNSGGGQPTILAKLLPGALAIISHPTTVVNGQPTGVLVVKSSAGTLAINTTNSSATAIVAGSRVGLTPGEVKTL